VSPFVLTDRRRLWEVTIDCKEFVKYNKIKESVQEPEQEVQSDEQ
jgi:hypothetical protein